MAIVQSHNTDDFYIQNACNLQLEETYNRILEDRKELNYPPFSRLIKILFLGKKEIDAKKKSQKFLSILKKNSNIQILGPSLAPIEYMAPYWRYQILIKCKKFNIIYLYTLLPMDFIYLLKDLMRIFTRFYVILPEFTGKFNEFTRFHSEFI